MFVRESGARGASAILMLHGQGLDGSVFDGLASRLSARFHVLVPDMPGYGRSPPIEPYTVGAIRAALERELEARGVASTSIVGFSIGTYHALAFALAGRIRVERLVLLGVLAGASAEMKAAFAGHARAVRAGAAIGSALVEAALPPAWREAHPEEVTRLAAQVDAAPRDVMAADFDLVAELDDLHPRLGEIRAPTLVRVGSLDLSTPPEWSDAVARSIPGATMQVAQGVGHLLLLQDAENTGLSVERFLAPLAR